VSTAIAERARFVDLSHEPGEWDAAVRSWPASAMDVYFSSGYHRAFAHGESAHATLYVFERNGERLLYPFLLRRIDRVGPEAVSSTYRDIESVYGFTGPLASTADTDFLAAAWRAFDAWCATQHVVAEFVRFNPFLGNERYAAATMLVKTVREHVVLDLGASHDELWKNYSSVNRNMIRKAEERRVQCEFAPLRDHLDRFTDLYRETMERNEAGEAYYFTREQFAILSDAVPCFVTVARLDGEIAAISLFLTHESRVHYHLSGCADAGLRAAANNLLLHQTVQEARRRGYQTFHFGGGRTGSPADPLLKFKANFSRGRVPALVGGRVHDIGAYERLCALRRAQSSDVPDGYFLAYRYRPDTA
jgi:hypothetical protein